MKSILKNEMNGHIKCDLSIDSHQAKLGNDKDVSVIKLESNNKDVAHDLVQYIESGHKFVLDADFSPSKNTNGSYDIFVEVQRNEDLPKNIMSLVRDIEHITGIQSWKFKFHKNDSFHKMNEENLNNIIPTSPEEYDFLTDDKIDEVIEDFLQESKVNATRLGKKLTLNKIFNNHQFEIKSVNSNITKGVYKIDESSETQSKYLNSWIGGGYQVVKIDDYFKISKDNKTLTLKAKDF